MAITLRILVDLYLQRWRRPRGQREIWAIVHAHVHPDELAEFAAALDPDGGATALPAYEMVDPASAGELVPVPIPANLDLEVTLYDAGHRVVAARLNPRSTGNDLVDGHRFLTDNRDSLPPEGETSIEAGPYARSYLRQLRQLCADSQQHARARDWLRIGLWRGTRLRLAPGVLRARADDCDRMLVDHLPGEDRGSVVTGLHSMLGQTLRLYQDGPGAPDLTSVEWLSVRLNKGSQQGMEIPGSDVPLARAAWRGIFRTLDQPAEDPARLLGWKAIDNSRHVAVIDIPTGFQAVSIGGGASFFRRRNERSGRIDSQDLDSRSLRRIVLRHLPPQGSDPRQGFPAQPRNLALVLYNTIDVRLSPYRGSAFEELNGGLLRGGIAANDQALLRAMHRHPAKPLDRARLLPAHDAQTQAPAWIGSFRLPWDDQDDADALTLLWRGDRAAQESPWTLCVPCLHADGRPISVTLEPRDTQDPRAPLGPRWEARELNELRDLEVAFDSVELHGALADSDDVDPDRLRLSMYFDGDVEFRPAHGATQSEVIAGTRLRHADSDLSANMDPATVEALSSAGKEIAADLANFCSVNVVSRWAGRTELRNPHRDLYPQLSAYAADPDPGNPGRIIEQAYVWRAREDLPNGPDPQAIDRHYAHIGQARTVTLILEHSCGELIEQPLHHQQALATGFDFPIAHPAEVGEVSGRDSRTSPDPLDHQLLACRYERSASSPSQALRLLLDRRLLHPDHGDQALQAYRSLAELRHAGAIELRLRVLRFDHRAATSKNLADALAPVADLPDPVRIDITSATRSWAQALLADREGAADQLEIALPESLPDLVASSHALQVRLSLQRAPGKCLDPSLSYRFHRLLWADMSARDIAPDRAFSLLGKNAVEQILPSRLLPSGPWQGAFGDWLQSHRQRDATLRRPLHQPSQQQLRFEQFCSGGRGADWLVPDGQADAEGQASPCQVIPFGFRPLRPVALFGHATEDAFARLLSLLKGLLDCRLPTMVRWGVAQWKTWFGQLQAAAPRLRRLSRLTAERLLHPLPDRLQGQLDADIRLALNALLEGQNEGTMDAMRDSLQRALLEDPSLYAATRALLFLRLADARARLSADFVRLQISKQPDLDRPASDPAQAGLDHDQFWYHEAPRRLAGGPWYGFLDPLDKARYGNRCAVADLRLDGFETLVELDARALPIRDRQIVLPGGRQELAADDGAPQTAPMVAIHLPARRAAKAPAHLFSAALDDLQPQNALHRLPWPLDRSAFAQGRIAKAERADGIQPELIQQLSHRPRQLDRVIATVAWAIEGSEIEGLPGFERDLIEIAIARGEEQKSLAEASTSGASAILLEAASWSDVGEVPADGSEPVRQLIEPDALDELIAMVHAAEPPEEASDGEGLHVRIRREQDRFRIDALESQPAAGDAQVSTRAEAALLVDRSSGHVRHYLLLNVEVPVWYPTSIRARLLRNAARDEPGSAFDRAFWTAGEEPPDQRMLSVDRWASLADQAPVRWARQPASAVDLVDRLLVARGLLTPRPAGAAGTGQAFDWASLTAVISIEAVHRLTSIESPGGGRIDESAREVGRLPLLLREIRPRSNGGPSWNSPLDWAPDPYQDLVASIRWVNEANFTVLAISDCRFYC